MWPSAAPSGASPFGRDRRGRHHREPPPEVAGRLGHRHLERVVVDRPDAGDLVGVTGAEVVEALDRGVVEAVPAGAGLGIGLTLDRAHEVARGDLDVLERRGVHDPLLERERPGQGVLAHRRQVGGDVGAELGAAFIDRLAVRRVERP